MTRHPFLIRYLVSTGAATLAGIALILGLLWRANELPVLFPSAKANGGEILWGSAFYQRTQFKLVKIAEQKPDLVTFGSSRATQFRAGMFPGASFYNASQTILSLPEAEEVFARLLQNHTPKVVLLTIDPWWFNPKRGQASEEDQEARSNERGSLWLSLAANAVRAATKPETLRQLWSGPRWPDADPFGQRRPVGFAAAYKGSGTRPDGSFQYGQVFLGLDPLFEIAGFGWEKDFAYFRRHIQESRGRFGYTGEPSPMQAERLRRAVRLLQGRGVRVILDLPSFPAGLYEEILRQPEQRRFILGVEKLVEDVAGETGCEFYNFHNLARLGIEDRHTIDGLHVDEIATAASVEVMLKNSPALRSITAPDAASQLARIAADRQNWLSPYILFR